LVWVSVVVVVVGPGTVVDCDVVVVLCVVSDAHAERATRARARRLGTIIFFMGGRVSCCCSASQGTTFCRRTGMGC